VILDGDGVRYQDIPDTFGLRTSLTVA
jgi:hypothetical protein